MDTGEWTPGIPAGRVAVRAWKDLDRPVRRELLRSRRPHPDPMVAAVAVGYARAMQEPGRRIGAALRNSTAAVALIGVLTTVGAAGGTVPLAVTLPAGVVLLCGVMVLSVRQVLAHVRMEHANAPHLLAAHGADPPPVAPPDGGGPLVVQVERGYVATVYGVSIALIVAGGVLVTLITDPFVHVPVIAAFGVFVLFLLLLGWYVMRRGPALTVDAGGVESRNLRMAWPDVAEVRIVRQRMTMFGRGARRVIVFVAADPEAVIAPLAGSTAWMARRMEGVYGGPLALDDQIFDHDAAQIAAAVRACSHGTVPIRRLDGM
ncbi:hypothetical protein [Spirillospora sp. NPDC047279]|uniref:hypothetical protein n=1 Tax=Spirillospora sp. NPDC047279 TaxID=3155478 RepID=UPI0033FBC4E9